MRAKVRGHHLPTPRPAGAVPAFVDVDPQALRASLLELNNWRVAWPLQT